MVCGTGRNPKDCVRKPRTYVVTYLRQGGRDGRIEQDYWRFCTSTVVETNERDATA